MAQMVISQIQQAPDPDLGRKIPGLNSKIYYFHSKGLYLVTPKIGNPELQFLYSSPLLILILWTFMEISKTVFKLQSGNTFMTDRQTTLAKTISLPKGGGGHNKGGT